MCCIANPWSSFASEEERFESARKNADLLLCHAKAQGIDRTSHEHHLGLTHQVGCQRGRAVVKHVRVTTSVPDLENAVTEILMAAAWLYLSYTAILEVKC